MLINVPPHSGGGANVHSVLEATGQKDMHLKLRQKLSTLKIGGYHVGTKICYSAEILAPRTANYSGYWWAPLGTLGRVLES